MVLMCILVPVLLLATKYCVDLVSYHQVCLYEGGTDPHKKCAREAALAVAQKWNPGLTLKQQKESLLRIADDIYNKNPCHSEDPAHRAIPGLEIKTTTVTTGKTYDPFKIMWSDSGNVSGCPNVPYIEVTKNRKDKTAAVDQLFKTVFDSPRLSYLATEDAFWGVTIDDSNAATYSDYTEDASGSQTYSYTARETPGNSKVEITVEDDKIRVRTDDDVGYAVPAQCNVDVIMAIPTHSGAPLGEVAQAYRAFLADNFEFTRGVNVGLIPYSGKVSLPFGKDSWSKPIQQFDPDEFLSSEIGPYCRGYFFYGTKGVTDGDLADGYDDWGAENSTATGRAIMCRDDLLSIAAPATTTDATLFRRTNNQPCIVGYANLLSMKCERNCTTYLANPFPIVELMPDVGKMRDLMNVIVPFSDAKNTSNFIFIPITWANNLLQSWTDGQTAVTAVNTTEDPESGATEGRLFIPSKSNKKQALILVVNKPDYFAPNELTYLGFDNDFSEVPMVESEVIDFSQNFDSNPIQGPKGILKFEVESGSISRNAGYYETSDTAAAKLTFPVKGRVKIVVGAAANAGEAGGSFTFSNIGSQNTIQPISGTDSQTFVVQLSEIPDTKCVTFTLDKVKLISAEISNVLPVVAAAASLSGITEATALSTATEISNIPQPAEIITNNRESITVSAQARSYTPPSTPLATFLATLPTSDGFGVSIPNIPNGSTVISENTSMNTDDIPDCIDRIESGATLTVSGKLTKKITVGTINGTLTMVGEDNDDDESYRYTYSISSGGSLNIGTINGTLTMVGEKISGCSIDNGGSLNIGTINGTLTMVGEFCGCSIHNGGSLNIGTINGTLTMVGDYNDETYGCEIFYGSSLNIGTISGGTITISGHFCGCNVCGGSLNISTISGGTVTMNGRGGYKGCYIDSGGSLNIGTVSGGTTIMSVNDYGYGCEVRDGSSLNIGTMSGGIFKMEGYDPGCGIIGGNLNIGTISGGTLTMEGSSTGCEIGGGSLNIGTISSGTITINGNKGYPGCSIYEDGNLNILQNFGQLSSGILSGSPSVCNQSAIFHQNEKTLLNPEESKAITISPDTHNYEDLGNGTYKITLDIANVELTLPSSSAPAAPAIRLPNLSRTVDFSKNIEERPQFIGEIAYGESEASHGAAGAEYNAGLGYWVAKDSGDTSYPRMSGWNKTFNKNIAGDFYLLLEYMSGPIPLMRLFCDGPDIYTYNGNDSKCEIYNFRGLHRIFLPFDKFTSSNNVNFDIEGISSSTCVVKFIMTGFTLPINRALCERQIEPNNTLYDATSTCRTVTTAACRELQKNTNLKIYVVKYRKQGEDYGYIDSCASDVGYVYDVDTNYYKKGTAEDRTTATAEKNLAKALADIAADIKLSGNHEAAKNVP
ncbi:MAG: hypothetical protein LBJ96_03275 [Holosporaceae bacterium]|jgi:hypothetical protein|nr:hypothetical protein [Holosporaceae bacterium]